MTAMPKGGEGFESYDLVNQLNEPTEDGKSDENARMNCVVASFASVVMELKPGVITDGDYIKDKVYGQGYTGGMSGEAVAPFLLSEWGIKVDIIHSTDRAYLMSVIKSELSQKHPVVITMPSLWNTQPTHPNYDPNKPNFGTHAGAAFECDATDLSVMNPWGGFVQTETFAWWELRLCYGKVYVCSLEGASTVTLPYTKNSDGTLSYKAGNIGVGFATLVESQNRTADLVIPETYIDSTHSFCLFADGAVYMYDATAKICDDTHAAEVVHLLYTALKNQPTKTVTVTQTPPELTGAISDCLNVFAPFVNAYNELKKVA
jgi:hypothetical protein